MEGGPRRCHGRGARNHPFVGFDLRITKYHTAFHRTDTLEKGTTVTAPLNTTLYMRPDRNLALELVRVTEAGAMAAGRWVGRGDKEAGDGAAVDAMRQLVALVSMRGGGRHRRGREGRSANALQRRRGRQRAGP